jgi:hypothetical protein
MSFLFGSSPMVNNRMCGGGGVSQLNRIQCVQGYFRRTSLQIYFEGFEDSAEALPSNAARTPRFRSKY